MASFAVSVHRIFSRYFRLALGQYLYFWSATFKNLKKNAETAWMRIQRIGNSYFNVTLIYFFFWTHLTDKWHKDKNRYSIKEETQFYDLISIESTEKKIPWACWFV